MPRDKNIAVRLLLVEDEAVIARDLERRLRRLGYDVVGVADTGSDALALALALDPALVLMDIVLQGPMDGVDTAAALVRQLDVPVVFLTAHSDALTIDRTLSVAPHGYLCKPFEDRQIHTTIEMALYRHERDAEARLLHNALSHSTTGIVMIDAAHQPGTVTLCNQAFARMTGHAMSEIVGASASWLASLSPEPAEQQALMHAIEARVDARRILALRRHDGTSWWCDMLLSPVLDATGHATHLFCACTDVTARKAAEEALLRSQKLESIGQLAGGIAHDFNNILAAILSFAGFVRDELPAGDPRRADIIEVLRAADRAVALTRQLLAFSRQHPIAKRPIDLNEAIASIIKMLRRSVGENILLEAVPSPQPAVVYMDPIQLDQVILNLAVNARDAMPGGGRLRFTIAHPAEAAGEFAGGEYVRLTCEDTGCGIDAATVPRIFEPLFTTKPAGKGTGLGLATCYNIVKDASGDIAVASELGAGTIFTIDLPRCELPVARAADAVAADVEATGERVLVVEDDAAVREAAVRTLTAAGYVVSQAHDGSDALLQVAQSARPFDLVVSDIVMPGCDGYAVLAQVRKREPRTRMLFISGYLDGRVSIEQGADPILWKPFTSASLLQAARAVLRTYAVLPASA